MEVYSHILSGLKNVASIMDDIIIYAETQEIHDKALLNVLQRLSSAGVTLNRDKCQFSVTKIKFVGHFISKDGIQPDPNKIQAIVQIPPTNNVSELHRFLGMVTYSG